MLNSELTDYFICSYLGRTEFLLSRVSLADARDQRVAFEKAKYHFLANEKENALAIIHEHCGEHLYTIHNNEKNGKSNRGENTGPARLVVWRVDLLVLTSKLLYALDDVSKCEIVAAKIIGSQQLYQFLICNL